MYQIPKYLKVTLRGKIAYEYYHTNNFIIESDFDIQVSDIAEYEIIKHYFSSDYNFHETGFYKIKNVPRKRLKAIINGDIKILDILISNNHYLERKLVSENLYIPEVSELIAEFLIAVSNTNLGIENDNSKYYNNKINSLYQRISNLAHFNCDDKIILSLNHHIRIQNSFYETYLTLSDIVSSIFLKLQTIEDLGVRCTVKNLLIKIAILYFDTKDLDKINFFDADLRFGCFSNFSHHKLRFQNEVWPTSEHCYQAQKFLSRELRNKILNANNPKSAAIIGRSTKPVRPNWVSIKSIIMYEIIYEKTIQNSEVLFCLISTVGKNIFEVNEKDDFWGLGINGQGNNMLGIILMTIRDELLKNLE